MRGDGRTAGVLPLVKPVGPTSHDMVARARRWFPGRRVGHLGTLDPAAAGVLVLLVGGVTRAARFLDPPQGQKTYRAWVEFGLATDSGDADGVVIRDTPVRDLTEERVRRALEAQVGTYDQIPPALSAVMVRGERAYRRTRAGESLDLEGRPVTVHRAELLVWRSPGFGSPRPRALVEYTVSRGTYVRALVRDLGEGAGEAAYVAALVRMRVGDVRQENCITWEEAEGLARDGLLEGRLLDVAALLTGWPEMIAPPDPHGRRIGRGLPAQGAPEGWTRLVAGLGRPTWCLARIEKGQFTEVVRLTEEVLP